MKKSLLILVIGLGLLLGGLGVATSQMTLAASKNDACVGVGLAGGTNGCDPSTSGPTVNSAIVTVINLMFVVVGVVAVIMVIIGGLKYVMSSGDSNSISSAKNTVLYAIIGLIIVGLAQIIVKFVLDKTP